MVGRERESSMDAVEIATSFRIGLIWSNSELVYTIYASVKMLLIDTIQNLSLQ
jgi:hypothetical protein